MSVTKICMLILLSIYNNNRLQLWSMLLGYTKSAIWLWWFLNRWADKNWAHFYKINGFKNCSFQKMSRCYSKKIVIVFDIVCKLNSILAIFVSIMYEKHQHFLWYCSNFVYPKIILHNLSHVIIHWFYQLPNVLQTRQTVEKLQSLISSDGRFRNLRDSLHRTDPPCIPYLGMYLSDLTFIEEGTPNFTDNGLLNFAKMRMVMFK